MPWIYSDAHALRYTLMVIRFVLHKTGPRSYFPCRQTGQDKPQGIWTQITPVRKSEPEWLVVLQILRTSGNLAQSPWAENDLSPN